MLRSITLVTTLSCIAAQAASLELSQGQHQLTLYQSDLALITSRFSTPTDSSFLQFRGVPSGLLPSSVHLTGSPVQRQLWRTGLSFEQRLSEKVGQELTLVHLDSAESRSGRLLGFNGSQLEFEYQGAVLRYPINGEWQPQLSPYSPSQTALELDLAEPISDATFDLSYLTQGLNWQTEYRIELQGESRIDLRARAALYNQSDAELSVNARYLLAGSPKTPPQAEPMLEIRALSMASPAMADAVSVAKVQGYQLFELAGSYQLASNSVQRVPLFNATDLPAKVSYQVRHPAYVGMQRGNEQQFAQQQLRFDLDEAQIDKPLPAGAVELFKRDAQGILRFVGADRLSQFSPGEQVELNYGEVFDLRAERRQLEYERNGNTFLQSYQVRLINGAKEPRSLEYLIDVHDQWSLVDSSHLATVDGMQARWLVEVPAQAELILSYTLRLIR